MFKNNDNVVSKNLPIYFIWFGSDVPPKYFSNLQRTADTNKSRDIILVYSDEHLLEDNRKNIDSMESIGIDDIKTRVELERDSNTKNLWKIDVHDMELDEQVYDLLNKVFTAKFGVKGIEMESLKFCMASDLLRLPLLNIIGGIYFDMDTEVTGEIGEIGSKKGFNYQNYYGRNNQLNVAGNILIKTNKKNDHFDELMKKYFNKVKNIITGKPNCGRGTDPVNYLNNYVEEHYIRDYIECFINERVFKDINWTVNLDIDQDGKDIKFRFYNIKIENKRLGSKFQGRIDSQTVKSEIYDQIIYNYGIDVPPTVKLKMEVGEGYNINYNNPEDLKKLGLDKTDVSSKLKNLKEIFTCCFRGNSEEKSR